MYANGKLLNFLKLPDEILRRHRSKIHRTTVEQHMKFVTVIAACRGSSGFWRIRH